MLALLLALLMLTIVSYLGRCFLSRKINPNKKYLDEIKEIKKIKILNSINSIFIFIIMFIPNFDGKIILLVILISIIEIIRTKHMMKYLNTKSENKSTLKYILYDLVLQFTLAILIIGFYSLWVNIFMGGCFKWI